MWMGSVDDLGDRLRLELERCSRYGVPASFLAIQAAEWKDTSREGIDVVDRYVLTHFTGGLRPSDSLYRFGYPGCYLLVLAGTSVDGAEAVRARLQRRLEYSSRREIGRIDVFATGPDAEAPDLLSLADRVARRFREQSALPLEGRCPVQVPKERRIGDIDAFLRRLRMEASLAARNSFDLHVVGIAAEAEAEGGRDVLARHLNEVGEQVLRSTDGVYAIGPSRCAVVLPSTGDEDAALVAHRLVHAVRERDPAAGYGDLETQVLGFGPEHPDASSFLEALARRRGGRPT
jgi:GGDEF domain-containing protein